MASTEGAKLLLVGSGGMPPQEKLKSNVKTGLFCAFWGLYLDKNKIAWCCHFQKLWGEIPKKAICPKFCEIVSPCELVSLDGTSLWVMPKKIGEGHGNSARVDNTTSTILI